MVLYILHKLIPVADIYANLRAPAIWEQVQSALARRGQGESAVTFSMVELNDDGNIRREIRGETRNEEAIKELIRQFGRD